MSLLSALSQWFANIFGGKFRLSSDGSVHNGERSNVFPSGMSAFTDNINEFTDGVGQIAQGSGSGSMPSLFGALTNWLNAMSGQHMTNAEVERNELSMQNQEDIFQRQVTGMQSAGLNPALMYQNGVGSGVPQANGSAPGASMSDLMSMILAKKQADLLDAQKEDLHASRDLKTGEAGRIPFEIQRIKTEIAGLDLDNASKEIINRYLDRQQRADLALKGASQERLQAMSDNLVAQINRMDYQNALDMARVLEVQEHISVLRSEVSLNKAQASELAKYADYLEKQSKVLQLTADDWDFINTVGTTSTNTKFGPFGVGESRPLTLGELKNIVQNRIDETDPKKRDERTWRDIKDEYPE